MCPNVVKTGISTGAFYETIEKAGLLTPMDGVVQAFESMLGDSKASGECYEIPPTGGFHAREVTPWLDDESKRSFDLLYHRGRPLHEPKPV